MSDNILHILYACITYPPFAVWADWKVTPDFMTSPSYVDKPVTLLRTAALRKMERHLLSENSIVTKPISTQITQTHIHIHTTMIDTDKHSIISSLCGFWSSMLWIETDRICSFVSRHKKMILAIEDRINQFRCSVHRDTRGPLVWYNAAALQRTCASVH